MYIVFICCVFIITYFVFLLRLQICTSCGIMLCLSFNTITDLGMSSISINKITRGLIHNDICLSLWMLFCFIRRNKYFYLIRKKLPLQKPLINLQLITSAQQRPSLRLSHNRPILIWLSACFLGGASNWW